MRRAVVLVLATGCSQIFGLDHPVNRDAGVPDDVVRDAPDAGVSCVERWLAGPELETPTPLAGVNTSTQERLPFVTDDGMELYYIHDGDVYVATLSGGAFGAGTRVDSLSSGTSEGRAWVASSGQLAFFSSNRNGGGPGGGAHLWRATRPDTSSAWTADQMYLGTVNATNELSNPFLSPDLLHMYYGSKGDGISLAERASVDDAFGAGATITSLSGPVGDDDAPTISADGRLIVFESRRTGNDELFYATRADATAMFSTPALVPTVNAPNRADTSPALSADACRLYFSSDRGGTQDLYVAKLAD